MYKVIAQDQRNHSTTMLWQQPIAERNFANWSMVFQDLEDIDMSKIDGFLEFLKKGFTTETVSENKGMIQDMLMKAKKIIEEKESR